MAVQTQIQTRRGTAATWTSTNPTLAAGEIGFETDTNKFKIGTGSTAWTALAYAANLSPLTTKGDLYTYSTDNTRLAVGANGETIVADSSTSTGLRYQGNFAAGKNKIINGDFGIWQRGTSFTPNINVSTYCADRFGNSWSGTGTTTFSQQTFSPGTAPVAGYEGQYFLRAATSSGATYVQMNQPIEDVRTFAGQTITLSFWAKSSSTFTTRPIIRQAFGSGGSANVDANLTDTTFTTSWARYSWTTTLASIAGKTVGAGSSLTVYFVNYQSGTIASNNIDVWGVQVEAGSVATAFQTATGTIQGELAACQRYYTRLGSVSGNANQRLGVGPAINSTTQSGTFYLPTKLRTSVTSIDYSTLQLYAGGSTYAITAATLNAASELAPNVNFTVASGLTGSQFYEILTNGTSSGYIGFNAEL